MSTYAIYIKILPGFPPRSRVTSRAASPALSVKSKRSQITSRSRNSFVPPEITDDEDSDEQLLKEELARARNRRNENRRLRKNSESFGYESHDSDAMNRIQKIKEKSKMIRERRSGSLSHWPVVASKFDSDNENEKQKQNIKKFDSLSLASPVMSRKMITTDSMTSDVETDIKKVPRVVIPYKSISATPKIESEPETAEFELRKLSKPVSKALLKEPDQEIEKTQITSTPTRSVEPLKMQILAKSPTPCSPVESSKDWECEHCTFVNESISKICGVCCKTPAIRLKTLPSDEVDIDIPENLLNQDDPNDEAKKKGRTKKISFLPGTKAH